MSRYDPGLPCRYFKEFYKTATDTQSCAVRWYPILWSFFLHFISLSVGPIALPHSCSNYLATDFMTCRVWFFTLVVFVVIVVQCCCCCRNCFLANSLATYLLLSMALDTFMHHYAASWLCQVLNGTHLLQTLLSLCWCCCFVPAWWLSI